MFHKRGTIYFRLKSLPHLSLSLFISPIDHAISRIKFTGSGIRRRRSAAAINRNRGKNERNVGIVCDVGSR